MNFRFTDLLDTNPVPTLRAGLQHPYAFAGEGGLLRMSEFISEARLWGVALSPRALLRLAQIGVLEPLALSSGLEEEGSPLRAAGDRSCLSQTGDLEFGLRNECIYDPAEFRSLPGFDWTLWITSEHRSPRRPYYSLWQLVGLPLMQRMLENDRHDALGLAIDRDWTPDQVSRLQASGDRGRQQALLLGVLSPLRLPAIRGVARGWVSFDAFNEPSVDTAPATLFGSDESHRGLIAAAGGCLYYAGERDPAEVLAGFTRALPYQILDKFRGSSRDALWARYAAEVLYRTATAAGAASTVPEHQALDGGRHGRNRFKPKPAPDAAKELMKLGVSSSPRVLILVEGQCEQILSRHLLRLWDVPTHLVRVQHIGGVDNDVAQIAAYAAGVFVDNDLRWTTGGEQVRGIEMPFSRIMLLTDNEGKWEDARREKTLADLRARIRQSARENGLHAAEDDALDHLVEHLQVSSGACREFEFANYTFDAMAEFLAEEFSTWKPRTEVVSGGAAVAAEGDVLRVLTGFAAQGKTLKASAGKLLGGDAVQEMDRMKVRMTKSMCSRMEAGEEVLQDTCPIATHLQHAVQVADENGFWNLMIRVRA